MAEESTLPKPKKSVALSGTVAGNTAVCTVGRTGNDLHYRGYDILDLADELGRRIGDGLRAGAAEQVRCPHAQHQQTQRHGEREDTELDNGSHDVRNTPQINEHFDAVGEDHEQPDRNDEQQPDGAPR